MMEKPDDGVDGLGQLVGREFEEEFSEGHIAGSPYGTVRTERMELFGHEEPGPLVGKDNGQVVEVRPEALEQILGYEVEERGVMGHVLNV